MNTPNYCHTSTDTSSYISVNNTDYDYDVELYRSTTRTMATTMAALSCVINTVPNNKLSDEEHEAKFEEYKKYAYKYLKLLSSNGPVEEILIIKKLLDLPRDVNDTIVESYGDCSWDL